MIKKRNIKAKNIRSSTTTTTTTADDDRNNESIHPQQPHPSTQSHEHENRPENDSRDNSSPSSPDTQRSQLNDNDNGEHHNDHNNQQSDQNREEMDTSRKVELVKLKQRSSAKRKGVMIKDSTGQPIKSSSSSSSSTHSTTTNQTSSSSSSLSSSSSSILSSSVSSSLFEGKFAARAKSETEKKMEEFVEMEMKKRGFMTSAEKEKLLSSVVSLDDDDDGGGESQQQLQQAAMSTNGSANGKKSAKMSIDITELYKIPDQYRPNRSLFKDDPIPGSMMAAAPSHDEMSTDMVANDDGDDNNNNNNGNEENTAQVAEYERRMAEKQQLMTGSILEVKLPMEYRIKNVQETEKAAKSAKRLHHEAQYTTVTSSEGTKVIVPTRQVRTVHHHSSVAGDHPRGMRTTGRSAAPSSSNDDAELRQYLGDDGDDNGDGGGDSNASDVNNERVDHGSSRERDDRQRQQSTGRGRDNHQHQHRHHNSNRRQGSGKRPHAVASDDAHFERFIKRYRRR